MTHETLNNKYDYKIVEKDWRPSKENPEKVIIEVKTALENKGQEIIYTKNFNLRPNQLERHNEFVKNWIDDLKQGMKISRSLPSKGSVVNADK